MRKRRKTTDILFCAQKTSKLVCSSLLSSINIVERRQRSSQEEEEFLSFSLSLPLFIFLFLLAIDTKALRAAEIRYTVIYIIQLILFLGKPPPSVTFDKRPTTRTMTSTTISSLSSRLISSLLSSSSTSSSSRWHNNKKKKKNHVFKIENAGKKSAFRLSNNKRKAKKTKQEEKDEMKRAFDGEGLSPEERVSGAKHKARRWLGQHFLIDHSVLIDAVRSADVTKEDVILEIGPGTGNLTAELLRTGCKVIAVEKDRNLAKTLRETLGNEYGEDELEIVEEDFMKWKDLDTKFIGLIDGGERRAKVVANIPYNITTDILKRLLPMGDTFEDLVFMFQEEIARRLATEERGEKMIENANEVKKKKKSNSDFRAMSVRTAYYSESRYIRPVAKDCFDPPPNVESCLIGFKPKRKEHLLKINGTEKQFFTFVQSCFAQKRKMLKNNLRATCDAETIDLALEILGRGDKVRPQELFMEDYVELFNFVREERKVEIEEKDDKDDDEDDDDDDD